jgi:hypothetical protein
MKNGIIRAFFAGSSRKKNFGERFYPLICGAMDVAFLVKAAGSNARERVPSGGE